MSWTTMFHIFQVIFLTLASKQLAIADQQMNFKDARDIANSISNRDQKVFSIFSIVQFQNLECTSEMTINNAANTVGTSPGGSAYRNGTCLTTPECEQKGGQSSGSCAGGFGVCCVFMVTACGSTISQNCSYIKNPSYPNAYPDTTACSYTITKCDCSICGFRLDFEQFTTRGPTLTTEDPATADPTAVCLDILQISSTTNTGPAIPVICGANAGQHVYIDAGRSCSDTGTINFSSFSNLLPAVTSFNRFWDIKVSQIPCDANFDQPEGCLQYHTGIDGRFETFNFPGGSPTNMHLQDQDYRICIRQEEGYCCIRYRACDTAFSMSLSNGGTADFTTAKHGSDCTRDYLLIEGSSGTGTSDHVLQNRYCGGILSATDLSTIPDSIIDCTGPFSVGIVTDALQDAAAATTASNNRGTCLHYTQIPCSSSPQGI